MAATGNKKFINSGGSQGSKAPFLIGVTGGTSCGKTEVCQKIISGLNQDGDESFSRQVSIVSQDCFYKSLNSSEKALADQGEYNFDHPDAFDSVLMIEVMQKLSRGEPVSLHQYNFNTCQRSTETTLFQPTEVVLLEGILMLYYPEVRKLLQMKLFVDLDSDTRLCRRVERDTKERGRDLTHILWQYTELVKPAFEEFTLPTKKYADVIIPRGVENRVAIDLIVHHIRNILQGNMTQLRRGTAVASGGNTAIERRRRHSSLSDSVSRPH